MKVTQFLVVVFCFVGELAFAQPEGVDFLSPADGATVSQTFPVKFAVYGLEVQPAGKAEKNKGHHHLLIDSNAVPEKQLVPNDKTHLHFGKRQTETIVTLKPGRHTLTLQFADGTHLSYGPKYAKTISINVK